MLFIYRVWLTNVIMCVVPTPMIVPLRLENLMPWLWIYPGFLLSCKIYQQLAITVYQWTIVINYWVSMYNTYAYLNLQKSQHFQERASYIYLLGMFYLACNKLTLALENFISLASIDVQILPKLWVTAHRCNMYMFIISTPYSF